ncbi:MAG: 5'-methylthioadenosine/S-adenosylhomocysteine nucleosidase [Gammaproteobacteria bacterium]|nr:5'-methylthioadenosine/S-adenosylhomocysteine nucleosidase [Gammaproteobacteria bacterium]
MMTGDKKKYIVDIGIITIKPEEYTAVAQRLEKWIEIEENKHIYLYQSIETSGGHSFGVAVARCLEQGNREAQALANDMIADFAPKWLLLAGIAGGIPAPEYSLGDVLLCTRLHDFSVCCVSEDQPPEFDLRGGPVHPHARKILEVLPAYAKQLDACGWNSEQTLGLKKPDVDLALKNDTEKIYGDEDWKKNVRESLEQNFSQSRKPKFHLGSTGSSDRLVKSPRLIQQWKPLARGLTHVEMELAGVYKAASDNQTPVLAIRGLSDIVGYKRSSDWTNYACETAASFAIALIRSGLLLPSGTMASSGTDSSAECSRIPKSDTLAASQAGQETQRPRVLKNKPKLSRLRRDLNEKFDDTQLDDFCMIHFPAVYDRFTKGMLKDQKIHLLLDHCRRSEARMQELLDDMKGEIS